ncbi:MAG: amino acid racemase [Desulfobacterales bacterium]|nr:amino acid racemase [Desulfobacterales bacterium]
MAEKIIGILGGMGPEATIFLFNEIVKRTPAEKDQDHLQIVIANNPKVPDRTAAIIGNGEDPVPEMVKSGKMLERAGADFIIMPCMSAHCFLEGLKKEISLPVISALEELSKFIRINHPDVKTVGMLATSGSIKAGLFQEKLLENNINTITPEVRNQEAVMSAIYSIKGDPGYKLRAENKAKLIAISEALIEKGAQGIIAGCTEIPLALDPEDITLPLFNPMIVLAEAAIREASN